MTSFGSALLSLFATATALAAQTGPVLPPAPAADSVVRARVAEQWQVDPVSLALSWGRFGPGAVAAPRRVRLLGTGRDGWFVAVLEAPGRSPEAVRVRVSHEDSVWVAAGPLVAGSRLTESDIVRVARPRFGPPVPGDPAPIGWQVRRALAAGDLLAAPAVTEPPLVEAGAPVTFRWERGAVRISFQGVALHSAWRGEPVHARRDGVPGNVLGRMIAPGVAQLVRGGGA